MTTKEMLSLLALIFMCSIIASLYSSMVPSSPFNYVCKEEILILQEVKDIKNAGVFSEQHNYYFVFTTGDTIEIYDYGKVAAAKEGDEYRVIGCRGTGRNEVTQVIERIER